MRKGNASLFGTTLVITAAIVAGVYLLDRAQPSEATGSTEDRGWTTLITAQSGDTESSTSSENTNSSSLPDTIFTPLSRSGRSPHPGSTTNLVGKNPATSSGNVSAETSRAGSANSTIITCQHPEYGTVYSNAANCDEVDYENRLSRAETFEAIPERERYSGTDYHSPESAAANSRSYNTNKKQ